MAINGYLVIQLLGYLFLLLINLSEVRILEELYIAYVCKKCNKETILITNEVDDTHRNNGYICCSHCGSKKLIKEKTTSDLREVIKSRSYKRVNGYMRQR